MVWPILISVAVTPRISAAVDGQWPRQRSKRAEHAKSRDETHRRPSHLIFAMLDGRAAIGPIHRVVVVIKSHATDAEWTLIITLYFRRKKTAVEGFRIS